jgi:excinuclease ABC subunit C
VGPATAKALLAHFKTVGAVKQAACEQLAAVPGVSVRAARAVYNAFHADALDEQVKTATLDKTGAGGDNSQ